MDESKIVPRILQVNLSDSGGAFSLIYQAQHVLYPRVKFDYFTMGGFQNSNIVADIHELEGDITDVGLRRNRLIGHLLLPFIFGTFLKQRESCYSSVHIHSDTAWKILLYAIPAKLVGIKNIIVHSHANGVNGDYQVLKKCLHIMTKNLFPIFANTFLSCSEEAARWMYPKSIQEKVVLVKNGINTYRFRFLREKREVLRNKYNVSGDCLVICMITDYSSVKNTDYAFYVIKELLKKCKCNLMLIGNGEKIDYYRKLAKKLGLQENTIFVGKVENVEDYLSASDVFIMPSLSEGFPMSALEAEASGLKCVFSKNISYSVDVLQKAKYIDTDVESISQWVDELQVDSDYPRNNAYLNLKNKGYDVENTSESLLAIYGV